MMGVNHVRARQSRYQGGSDRSRRMAAQPGQGAQGADAQAAWLAVEAGGRSERHQLALHLPSQGARQLERVALSTSE
jgi:hypothetical protein